MQRGRQIHPSKENNKSLSLSSSVQRLTDLLNHRSRSGERCRPLLLFSTETSTKHVCVHSAPPHSPERTRDRHELLECLLSLSVPRLEWKDEGQVHTSSDKHCESVGSTADGGDGAMLHCHLSFSHLGLCSRRLGEKLVVRNVGHPIAVNVFFTGTKRGFNIKTGWL